MQELRLSIGTGWKRCLRLIACLAALATASTSTAAAQKLEGPGFYLQTQAASGAEVYRRQCSACHGRDLMGPAAPPLAGPGFVRAWSREQLTLDELHYIISSTMPPEARGQLPPSDYVDVLAYILQQNGYPAGTRALTADRELLSSLRIEPRGTADEREAAAPPEFIEGEGGMLPRGSGPSEADLLAAAGNSSDWLFHTHDYTGRRYVDLDQINRENVGELAVVCAYQFGDLGNFQTGPIVHDGIMYATTAWVTVALDATSCRPLWRHEWEPLDSEGWLRNRGVALKDGYVVRGTPDGYLIALDAADGRLLWARQVADPAAGETFSMAPLIYDDLILIGPAGSENAISGWVGAFRLADGEQVWRFLTVPGATREGGDSWGNPEGIVLGGGAVWTPFTLDAERGELYVAVTNPAPDMPAELRPGPNLYTNSLVALDVRSGALRWYSQLVPNDFHDWDLTQVSPLFSARVAGRQRDLVGTVGKDGVLRLLDRDSHERLWETPITTIENIDLPLTREGVRVCPGVLGGVEWNGPAYNPQLEVLFVNAVDWCTTFALSDTVRYVTGELYLGGTVELDSLSHGWLTAVNARDGSVRWRYRSERPMLSGLTTTSAGLVFTGEVTGDFLAFDAESGDVLYRFNTGGPIGGGVMTYAVDGKQYVATTSGKPSSFWVDEHPGSATIFVFALR